MKRHMIVELREEIEEIEEDIEYLGAKGMDVSDLRERVEWLKKQAHKTRMWVSVNETVTPPVEGDEDE